MQDRGDRRGSSARGSTGLLERERALEAIAAALAAARGREGRALLVEGHAGLGKTRLHEATLDSAHAAGMRVLQATGAELERNLAHGVTRQLLGKLLSALEEPARDALLEGAPDRVRVLAGASPHAPAPQRLDEVPVAPAMFDLLGHDGWTQPTLLAIDDLHWCDLPSLELVLYLLHRLDELPLAIVLSARPVLGEDADESLERIATHPAVALEQLAPLGREAVAELVRRELRPDAGEKVLEACLAATSGNPFYLRELLRALREDPELDDEQIVERARSLAPDAVTRSLRVRVGGLGREAGELARAVAILGDNVPLRQAAALSGLHPARAAVAADGLAAVEVLLAGEPLQYVHPLVRRAIELDIPAAARAGRHLDAARLLYAEGESAERVATHLLRGRAEGSEWVIGRLRLAAREARARGAARAAREYLERALDEPPTGELRTEVLAELGIVEAAQGSESAVGHLEAAVAASAQPRRRANLRLALARALHRLGLPERAAAAYEEGLADLAQARDAEAAGELRDSLRTGYAAAGVLVPERRAAALALSRELLGEAEERQSSAGQRILLSQAALHAALTSGPAVRVRCLAERAWGDGHLLEDESVDGIGWELVATALILAGELERAVEIVEGVLEHPQGRAAPLAVATARHLRAQAALAQGRIQVAAAEAEAALTAYGRGHRQEVRRTRGVLALCLIERDEPDRAEEQLRLAGPIEELRDLDDAFCVYARAELRLAPGRAAEALEDALRTRDALGEAIEFVCLCPWRTVAALAERAQGEHARALKLAREALAPSERFDILHARIRAIRILGLCQGGKEGLVHLQKAAELGAEAPPRLETVRALVDLGGALRRANRRAAAREPLRRAADAARAAGAVALDARSHTELSAAGSRPRREYLLSGPASLTPSERRIAELAARGQSNREIALALFVTAKTVEYHLRNAYRKLDVSGRGELAEALAREARPLSAAD